MPGWPGGLGNRLQDLRTLIDQGLGDRLQAIQEHRAALEQGRIAQAFRAAAEGQQEPSEALYAAKHRRAQGLPPETSFLQDVASLGPRAVGGAQKMAAAVPMAAEALWNDPLGSINRAGLAGQAATDAIVQGAVRPFTQFDDPNVDPVKQAADLALTVGGGGLATAAEREGLGVFGGRNAKTANIEKLTRASDMANGGFTPEEIWKETGWFKGPDDKWKFEIDDSASRVPDKTTDALMQSGSYGAKAGPAGEILEHPELYKAYPELQNLDTYAHYNANLPGSTGSYEKGTPGTKQYFGRDPQITMELNALAGPEGPRSIMLHELQHPIQDIEGFAKGGSPDDFGGFGGYRRLAGEVEARNVQGRRRMTDEQRRAIPPWVTQDTPIEQQHMRFGGSGPQASIKAYHGSPHDFESFDLEKARAGNYGNAIYLHEAEKDANRYKPEGGKTYEVAADFKRPFDMSKEVSADDAANILEAMGNSSLAEQARKSGKGYRSGNELWYWGLGQGASIADKQLALKKAGFDAIVGDPGREIAGKSTRSPEIAVFDDKLISILRKYGLPVSAAGLAALSQLHPEEAQAQPLGDRLQRGQQ